MAKAVEKKAPISADDQKLINEAEEIVLDGDGEGLNSAGVAGNDAKWQDWKFIPETLAFLITGFFPETTRHYTPQSCDRLAKAIEPVATKYGFEPTVFGPEIGLLMAGSMFALPAVLAYKARYIGVDDGGNKSGENLGGDGANRDGQGAVDQGAVETAQAK